VATTTHSTLTTLTTTVAKTPTATTTPHPTLISDSNEEAHSSDDHGDEVAHMADATAAATTTTPQLEMTMRLILITYIQ